MAKNIQARLTQDFKNPDAEWITYKKGQTGVYVDRVIDGFVTFIFDGYESEKERERLLKEKHGEGSNITEFVAAIPVEILEPIETD